MSATPVAASVPEEVAASIPVPATPPAARVPVYVPWQSNVDVNKRRRTTEQGGFEEEIYSGSVTELRSIGSYIGPQSVPDGSYIIVPNWVGEINTGDTPCIPRDPRLLQPHPGYTGPTPWYLDGETGSTPP